MNVVGEAIECCLFCDFFRSAGLSGYYSRNYTRQLLSIQCVELRRVYPQVDDNLMIFEHQFWKKKSKLVKHSPCNMTSSEGSLEMRNTIISLWYYFQKSLTKVILASILARSERHLPLIQSNLVPLSKFFNLLKDYENIQILGSLFVHPVYFCSCMVQY